MERSQCHKCNQKFNKRDRLQIITPCCAEEICAECFLSEQASPQDKDSNVICPLCKQGSMLSQKYLDKIASLVQRERVPKIFCQNHPEKKVKFFC